MIKGVNKHIIEVNNPDSIYFERAVFYLKPGVRELPSEITKAEVDRVISRFGLEEYGLRRKRRFGKIAILASLLTLLAVCAVIVLI